MAKLKSKWLILAIIILVIVSLLYMNRAYIADVNVINLDSSQDRWNDLKSELTALPYPIERFSAVDGRKMSEKDYENQGIPYVLWPSTADEKHKKARPGEIGCYLSHRDLIKKLGSKWGLPNAGHLVLEDDVTIDKDAQQRINAALRNVPSDWDILCLSVDHHLDIDPPVNGISKVKKFHGTHAMVIRHGSIPKIWDAIRIMFSPIDVMLYACDKLSIYLVDPEIVHVRKGVPSDIRD